MTLEFGIASLAAFILGVAKGGLKGLGIVIVTLIIFVYGAKNSTGILLPLLTVGDILAIIYFRRYVKWEYLLRFLPWVIGGVLIGVWIGQDMPEDIFKNVLAGIILFSVAMMWWLEYRSGREFKRDWRLTGGTGLGAGVATMLGNLAGPFSNIYFLSTGLPKNELIGTAAWLYFIVNLFKVPFHVFSWGTINAESLQEDLSLIPSVILGFWVGTRVVAMFSEGGYRKFLLIVTALGALLIFLR